MHQGQRDLWPAISSPSSLESIIGFHLDGSCNISAKVGNGMSRYVFCGSLHVRANNSQNLAKWQGVEPVSIPINGLFRAMKTLREVDETHSPKTFIKEWSPSFSPRGKDGLGPIVAVIDISHETPVYDMNKLESGGVAYRKFPTVSKLPPTVDEVKSFIEIVDLLRRELGLDDAKEISQPFVAVHCHYGFNRTGFFIIAYLVEKLHWKLKDAIDEFAKARPPGVRHSHFVDELYARYWTHDNDRS